MGVYRRLLIRALGSHSHSFSTLISPGEQSSTIFRRGMRQIVMSQAALDAAAERRRRKRKLRMEPPLNALQRNRDYTQRESYANTTSNSKLPEPITVLVGDRLNLHNRIQVLCREGNLDEAILGVRYAMFSNCRPTVFTCNAVLSHLQTAGKHAEVLSLFKFIRQCGVIPNLVTYNTVLGTHCKELDIDAAFEILKAIYAAEMTPSTLTFNHLMMAHFRLKKYEEVLRLFREMLEKCHDTDPMTYAATIEGFVNGGAMDQATELYMEMRQRGSIFSEPVFCNLIRGYFVSGRVFEAMEVFNFIPEKLEPTVMSYNTVLDGLFKAGRDQEAQEFFNSMELKNVKPDASTYAIYISWLIEHGNLLHALRIVEQEIGHKCTPSAVVYNVLLDAYFNGHVNPMDTSWIHHLIEDMVKKSCEPDAVTYDMLVDKLYKMGRLEDALKLFRITTEAGFRPGVRVYNKFLGHLCNEGKLNDAMEFFQEMVDGGQSPDVATYDILTEWFGKEGRVDEARRLFQDVLEKGKLSEELVDRLGGKTQEPKSQTQVLNVASGENLEIEAEEMSVIGREKSKAEAVA